MTGLVPGKTRLGREELLNVTAQLRLIIFHGPDIVPPRSTINLDNARCVNNASAVTILPCKSSTLSTSGAIGISFGVTAHFDLHEHDALVR